MLPQWHVIDPGHSAKSAGGRLHQNMHTPLTQWSWSGLTMLLSRHSVGNYPKQVYMQLVRERLTTVVSARWATVDWSGIKSGISVHELISTLEKTTTENAGREWIVEHSPTTTTHTQNIFTFFTSCQLRIYLPFLLLVNPLPASPTPISHIKW